MPLEGCKTPAGEGIISRAAQKSLSKRFCEKEIVPGKKR